MSYLSKERVNSIFNNFQNKKIAIIGDLMLDRYIFGQVSRISPEAPVPVVDVFQESNRLGGAANVANNIKSLGGLPIPIGIIGNDAYGIIMKSQMNDQGFITDGLIIDNDIPTTTKTRIIAHNQHVVRIDRENRTYLTENCEIRIIEFIINSIKDFDAIIFEDYNKGVVTSKIIQETIKLAKENNIPITVDPKFNNFTSFKGVQIFKPNKKEAEEALGLQLGTDEMLIKAMKVLIEKLSCQNVLITRGEKGMALMEDNGDITFIKTKAREIADVSGAGDTVISALTMALVGNASIKEAAMIANFAAGIVCGEVGVVPIEKDILINQILTDSKN